MSPSNRQFGLADVLRSARQPAAAGLASPVAGAGGTSGPGSSATTAPSRPLSAASDDRAPLPSAHQLQNLRVGAPASTPASSPKSTRGVGSSSGSAPGAPTATRTAPGLNSDDPVVLTTTYPGLEGVLAVYRTPAGRVEDPFRLLLQRRNLSEVPRLVLDRDPDVDTVSVRHNRIRAIGNLSHVSNLTFLDLANNSIDTVSGLSALPAVSTLLLGHNRIKHLSGLDSLRKLKLLDVQGNQLMVLSGMDHLTSLQVLNVEGNQLVKISNVASCVSLVEINARRNRLRRAEDVEVRPAWACLHCLCFCVFRAALPLVC